MSKEKAGGQNSSNLIHSLEVTVRYLPDIFSLFFPLSYLLPSLSGSHLPPPSLPLPLSHSLTLSHTHTQTTINHQPSTLPGSKEGLNFPSLSSPPLLPLFPLLPLLPLLSSSLKPRFTLYYLNRETSSIHPSIRTYLEMCLEMYLLKQHPNPFPPLSVLTYQCRYLI